MRALEKTQSIADKNSIDIVKSLVALNSQLVDMGIENDASYREGETSFFLGCPIDTARKVQFDSKVSIDILENMAEGVDYVRNFFKSYYMHIKFSADFYTVMGSARQRFRDFDVISDSTFEFILDHKLLEGVIWLHNVTPDFFPGSHFQIDILPTEDESDEELLALKVFGSFDTKEFRERRRRIVQAMIAANQNALYSVISIFQRRIPNSEWQTISFLSNLVAE